MTARKKADPDEWRDRLLADVADVPVARKNASVDSRIVVTIPSEIHTMILGAANRRRVSAVTYIRRSTYAMVAKDLGIPMRELTILDPRIGRDTGYSTRDPEMLKFPGWEIEALVGDEPRAGNG